VTGSQFLEALRGADEEGRELAILRELGRGNVPDFLRRLVRVNVRARERSGRMRSVTLWVTPDYLAIGDDADNVRMPMSPVTAQLAADRFGFVLPTPKIVDIIYQAAPFKIAPRSIAPSAWMVRSEDFARHDGMVDAQLGGAPRGLVAGHKKDVVLSNLLEERPHRVALYGWHQLTGNPIQPLSTLHGDGYCDYSHGVRLVAATMLLDGRRRLVAEVLRHPDLAFLLSYEGPLVRVRYRTEEGARRKKWRPAIPEKAGGQAQGAEPMGVRRARHVRNRQ
jgi:hypothetical protein